MPLPTMHLLVAEEAARRAGIGLSGRCLLGALAPDAIHMRKSSTPQDKNQTHLRDQGWDQSWNQCAQLLAEYADDPFVVGYVLHIMTDYLWVAGPWRRFAQSVPQDLSKAQVRKLYYRDMDHIDAWFFRQAGARRLWDAAMKAPLSAMPELLTLGEIGAWRRNRYGHLMRGQHMQPAGWISLDTARSFISEAGLKLAEAIHNGKGKAALGGMGGDGLP